MSNDDTEELQEALGRHQKVGRELLQYVEDLNSQRKGNERYCAFCLKGEHLVNFLVAGAEASICNECIALCVEVMKEKGDGL